MLEETFRDWERKLYQQGRREGLREARREARQEGYAQGLRMAVLEILRHHFGVVPQAVRQRVRETSSPSELIKLIRRSMNTKSLQETGLL
jgi:flagellar biosynthesis/type III secretory pathway protein FliH